MNISIETLKSPNFTSHEANTGLQKAFIRKDTHQDRSGHFFVVGIKERQKDCKYNQYFPNNTIGLINAVEYFNKLMDELGKIKEKSKLAKLNFMPFKDYTELPLEELKKYI